ncbi:hypothetical protein Ddye_022578 [Dipteronia dyeriana]|uniref:Late embryogenesis abundant protein LEA-2 subgroup domain-containing protein n=1 Tax=Dipteronia dyeriana TaxID=168575 RepID=A0AAD9WSI5_9ROSI|nr:hypothetical protein Ddye_022578 [Dipteronia dyeriana]
MFLRRGAYTRAGAYPLLWKNEKENDAVRTLKPPQPASDPRRFLFFRRLILALILLFTVIAVLNWTVWLILNPQPPVFRVNSLSMSNSTLYDSQKILKANYNLELSINNPNKKISLFMDYFRVFIIYKTVDVSKDTSMKTKLPVCLETRRGQSLSLLGDMVIAVGSSGWSRRSTVNVEMKVTIRFRAANLLTREKHMGVSCIDLGVEFINDRGKDCSLHFV